MSHLHITLNLILGSEVIKVVISVNDYKQIRQRYLNGESQRSIAKSMGISRNTVKKYCEGENVPWERKTPEREASVLTEDVLDFITSCLEEDEAEGLKKQRHTARRIFDRLVEEKGFEGGESTIRRAAMRSVARCHRHSFHFSSILLMRSRSIGVKPHLSQW